MRNIYFKYVSCLLLSASLFWQISTRHLSKDGKLFFISEPAKKVDHVTSKEECVSLSGSLLHADALTTGSQIQNVNLNLTANFSYWLDGSAPYLTNSCLLLSNNSTVMVAGCTQLHGYICEINLGLTSTILAAESSSTTVCSTSVAIIASEIPTVNVPHITIKPSFFYFQTLVPSAHGPQLHSTIPLSEVLSSVSMLQMPSTKEPDNSNILPIYVQSTLVAKLHENTSSGSEYGPHPGMLDPTFKNHSAFHNDYSVYCYKLFASLTVSELIRNMRNVSISDAVISGSLNESLLLNAKGTSKSRRKLTSAMDSRYSSRAIGGLAVVIITFVPVSFFLMDLPKLLKHLKYFKSK